METSSFWFVFFVPQLYFLLIDVMINSWYAYRYKSLIWFYKQYVIYAALMGYTSEDNNKASVYFGPASGLNLSKHTLHYLETDTCLVLQFQFLQHWIYYKLTTYLVLHFQFLQTSKLLQTVGKSVSTKWDSEIAILSSVPFYH